MSEQWSDQIEEERRPQKIEPWVAFGFALVITAGSVVLAISVWFVQDMRVTKAQETLRQHFAELATSQQESNQLLQQVDDLSKRAQQMELLRIELEKKLSDVTTSTEHKLNLVQGELNAITRERDQLKRTIEGDRRVSNQPESLPNASLLEAIGSLKGIVPIVFLNEDSITGLQEGSLREFMKQEGLLKCEIEFAESGNVLLVLNVLLVSQGDVISTSVSLELMKYWKVSGESRRYRVKVYANHTVGLFDRKSTPRNVEELVSDLFKDLAEELKNP